MIEESKNSGEFAIFVIVTKMDTLKNEEERKQKMTNIRTTLMEFIPRVNDNDFIPLCAQNIFPETPLQAEWWKKLLQRLHEFFHKAILNQHKKMFASLDGYFSYINEMLRIPLNLFRLQEQERKVALDDMLQQFHNAIEALKKQQAAEKIIISAEIAKIIDAENKACLQEILTFNPAIKYKNASDFNNKLSDLAKVINKKINAYLKRKFTQMEAVKYTISSPVLYSGIASAAVSAMPIAPALLFLSGIEKAKSNEKGESIMFLALSAATAMLFANPVSIAVSALSFASDLTITPLRNYLNSKNLNEFKTSIVTFYDTVIAQLFEYQLNALNVNYAQWHYCDLVYSKITHSDYSKILKGHDLLNSYDFLRKEFLKLAHKISGKELNIKNLREGIELGEQGGLSRVHEGVYNGNPVVIKKIKPTNNNRDVELFKKMFYEELYMLK